MNSTFRPIVFVVDHDESTGEQVKDVVKGVAVTCFRTGAEFLRFYNASMLGCVIVNIMLPDMSGIDLQRQLHAQYCTLPLIFVGTGSSVAQAVQVMRKGAVDFLDRPFRELDLLNAVSTALDNMGQNLSQHVELSELAARFEQLTPREREVLDAIVAGNSNRAIAETMGISEKTVETHRLRLMHKIQAKCLADLVRDTLRFRGLCNGLSSVSWAVNK